MDLSGGDDTDLDGNLSKREGADGEGSGRVAMQVSLLEHTSQNEATVSPLKEQEKKRPKRNGGGGENDDATKNLRSALSF